eukprot:Em0001g3750a
MAHNIKPVPRSTKHKKAVKVGGAMGGALGTAAGATTGAAIGAIVGSIVPVAGTIVGAAIGAAIGGAVGGTTGAITGAAAGTIAKQHHCDRAGMHHDSTALCPHCGTFGHEGFACTNANGLKSI